MWYIVTVVFDEEHRTAATVNASGEANAKRTVLGRFHMEEEDVLSVEAVPAQGMDESKTSEHYRKGE